ncbi:MAG: phosphatidate cytidylyltransferase [Candidatus Ancillula sp.]|jgi:phosphatidate cytidylyltransferase|nr:phosphatidate cytidylyltransferase [Candidatus Ancillula sp.]
MSDSSDLEKVQDQKNWIERIVTGIILGAIVIAATLGHPILITSLIILVFILSLYEANASLKAVGFPLPVGIVLITGVLMLVGALIGGMSSMLAILGIGIILLFIYCSLDKDHQVRVNKLYSGALVLIWIPFLLSFLVILSNTSMGRLKVLYGIFVVVFGDIGAMIVGKFLGVHKMSKISPGKTWEGLAGSFLFSIIVSYIYAFSVFHTEITGPFNNTFKFWAPAVFAIIITILGTLGDLAESLIKREAGVKDMGNALAGHGGFLDRIDSTLFAAPAIYYLLLII